MIQVAFLGAGAMGTRMITNLLQAGFDVTAWNRGAEPLPALVAAGAQSAPTPAAAAAEADVVISMLTDDDASRAVWLGRDDAAIEGMRSGAVAIECSSTTPDWSLELASALRSRGLAYVEAPVIGSRPQVEAGQLIHLVGADAADLEKIRPVLDVSAAAIRHVGPVGSAMVAKLAVNALFAIQVSAFDEVAQALQGSGFSIDQICGLFTGLPVTSPALNGIGQLVAAGDDEPRFPIDLVTKDLRYFAGLAESPGDWPQAGTALARFEAAAEAGLGGRNINAVVRARS